MVAPVLVCVMLALNAPSVEGEKRTSIVVGDTVPPEGLSTTADEEKALLPVLIWNPVGGVMVISAERLLPLTE